MKSHQQVTQHARTPSSAISVLCRAALIAAALAPSASNAWAQTGPVEGQVVVVSQPLNNTSTCLSVRDDLDGRTGQSFTVPVKGDLLSIEIQSIFVPIDHGVATPAARPSELWIYDGPHGGRGTPLLHTQPVTLVPNTMQSITLTSPVRLAPFRQYSFFFGNTDCYGGNSGTEGGRVGFAAARNPSARRDPYPDGTVLGFRSGSFSPVGLPQWDLMFNLNLAPLPLAAHAGGPYQTNEGHGLSFDASSTDGPGDPSTYAYLWDINGDGIFDDAGGGMRPTLSWDQLVALGITDGPTTRTVSVRVVMNGRREDVGPAIISTASTQLTVLNVPPTVDAGTDQVVFRNTPVTVSGSWTDPMGFADGPYAWGWDLDGISGDEATGSSPYGASVEQQATFSLPGRYFLGFWVRDDDGQSRTYDFAVIDVLNRPPDCSAAFASVTSLWPVTRDFVAAEVLGVTDPDGDATTITIESIGQDEAVDARIGGLTTPDAQGLGTSVAAVRAERTPNGNGRVYHIGFRADDGFDGGSCAGTVLVEVPTRPGTRAVDDGALFDSAAQP